MHPYQKFTIQVVSWQREGKHFKVGVQRDGIVKLFHLLPAPFHDMVGQLVMLIFGHVLRQNVLPSLLQRLSCMRLDLSNQIKSSIVRVTQAFLF